MPCILLLIKIKQRGNIRTVPATKIQPHTGYYKRQKEAAFLMSLYAVRTLGDTNHEVFTIRRSCLIATITLLVNTRI